MMTPEALFSAGNSVALLGWIVLVVSVCLKRPAFAHADKVPGIVIPVLLAVLYIGALGTGMANGPEGGGFDSIEGVRILFGDDRLLLAGWVHYLAFDLLVGTWIAINARTQPVPRLLVLPCLFCTFMFGPAGWLLYMTLRTAFSVRQAPVQEPQS